MIWIGSFVTTNLDNPTDALLNCMKDLLLENPSIDIRSLKWHVIESEETEYEEVITAALFYVESESVSYVECLREFQNMESTDYRSSDDFYTDAQALLDKYRI